MESRTVPSPGPAAGSGAGTLPPGLTRRRVWVAPEVTSHAAVILTATKLFLVPGTQSPPVDRIEAVRNGADPGEVFDSRVTVVPLGTVLGVAHDLLDNAVQLDAATGNGTAVSGTSRTTVAFATAEPSDGLFTTLWRRLGDEFTLSPNRPPAAFAAQAPLAALAGVLLATGLLAFGANVAQDFGPASPGWLAPLKTLDWRYVAACGGVAAAVVQVWAYRRLTRPPERLELIKGG